MRFNHKYFKEKSCVIAYPLSFLLGLEIDISFMKDIVETFHEIIKLRTFLLFKSYLQNWVNL